MVLLFQQGLFSRINQDVAIENDEKKYIIIVIDFTRNTFCPLSS